MCLKDRLQGFVIANDWSWPLGHFFAEKAVWQFFLGSDLSWVPDGGAHASESASTSDLAASLPFLLSSSPWVRLRGMIFKRFGGLWQDFLVGCDIEQRFKRRK